MEIDDKKEEKENEKNILRVIIVGDEDTGKTEYLDRVRNVDNRKLTSNAVEMRPRKIEIDDKTYFIEIIKIPGKVNNSFSAVICFSSSFVIDGIFNISLYVFFSAINFLISFLL